ncbi:unnamed protein product [Lupinus luteus]|uniref:Nodulin-like domain-containing protein n=1 Tax=Lupinus luteus TaxID=3873 RepID=A0AAV1XFY7_LUPLU
MINAPDQASIIFIIAVGPAMVSCALIFIIRPVEGYKHARASDGSGFMFIYSVCLLLASYIMGVLLLQNMLLLDQSIITLLGVILIIFILLPIIVPILLVFSSKPKSPVEQTLLEHENPPNLQVIGETSSSAGHVEHEKPPKLAALPLLERPREIVQFEAKDKTMQKNGPQRGEDYILTQALVNADFWIMFFSLVMGSGSGLTVINNIGQMCQSLEDNNVNVYISVISISNFLGRVAGGYFSEVIVRCMQFLTFLPLNLSAS